MRITDKELEGALHRLNSRIKDDFALEWAYGGVRLSDKFGGVDILDSGYTTKKDLYYLIEAYRQGWEDARKAFLEAMEL